LNAAAAKDLYKQLNKDGFTETALKGDFKNCNEQIYTQPDTEKQLDLLVGTAAVDAWYAGNADYDYEAGKASGAGDEAKAKLFTQVVWKNTDTVAFGIKDRKVYAWYCDKGNEGSEDDYKKNVGEPCVATGKKANSCMNEAYLEKVNAKRALHGSPDLLEDSVAAEKIQTAMNADTFENDPTKVAPEDGCAQVVFTYPLQSAQSEHVLMTEPNTAVDKWYAGSTYYDFAKGAVKYAEGATDAEKTQ